jgi:hypothetical protein
VSFAATVMRGVRLCVMSIILGVLYNEHDLLGRNDTRRLLGRRCAREQQN